LRLVSRASPFCALLLALLLSLQALPLLHGAAGATGAQAPLALGHPSVTFQPHYLILGQLEGSGIVQSGRPNSVPLPLGVSYASTYYTPQDLQNAYNASALISKGYDGKGETIAIIDAYGDPTINQDLASFDTRFGLPAANLTVIPVGTYAPENGITYGWDAEVALDVEAAHSMAPYAHINLLVAANASNALYEAVKMVVDDHLGDVVTMSWGLGENSYGESGYSVAGFLNYAYLDYYFQKGAAEGITFFASTGDYGAFDGTTTVTADFPSTSPFVTAVGGTTLFLASSKGYVSALNSSAIYQSEQAWSVSPQYVGDQGVSAGGGVSDIFAQPYYQKGATSSAARSVPDVSADANPYTGFTIVLEGGLYAFGGTSLASPLWAGMTADMDQYTSRSLGLLNPYLYSIYADKGEYDAAFHQVTSGFNGEYSAGPGYNVVTGLGTPDLPNLAADIANQTAPMSVNVTTSQGSSSSAPSQYTYGEQFTITTSVSTTQGPVTSGTVVANILGPTGQIAVVPLTFDGLSWTGAFTPSASDPAGAWLVEVYATSGGSSGYGMADVNVGDSLGIVSPVPYPFATTTPPGSPFAIEAVAQFPNGSAVQAPSLNAYLIYEGRTISQVTLNGTAGDYSGQGNITAGDPQGTYTIVVNGSGIGSVYSYLYVGQAVTGVILGPTDTAIPSASPGQQVVLLARVATSTGAGRYTSNVTAKVYDLSGMLVASADLHPSPNTVQFGVFDFFGYDQANFTLPSGLAQGFYKVQFLSSYLENSTSALQEGNFTTGFYVSSPTLNYTVSVPAAVYEGQTLRVTAMISNSTGAPVDSGVFFATAIPSGYSFESYVTDYDGYTGAPMQYNSTLGQWVAEMRIPSALSPFDGFTGNIPGLVSGPWTVSVSGESSSASNVVPGTSYMEVQPYTYYTLSSINATNVATAPLVAANGTGYVLSDIGADSLVVSGTTITLVDSSIGNLTLVNADVRLVASTVGSLSAAGSTLALLHGTQVDSLTMKSTKLTSSGSYYGQGPTASSGDYLLYGVAALAVVALVVSLIAIARKGPRPQTASSPPPQV
jgi:subtilase family serine protease